MAVEEMGSPNGQAKLSEASRLLDDVNGRLQQIEVFFDGWKGMLPWRMWRCWKLLRANDRDLARVRELMPW